MHKNPEKMRTEKLPELWMLPTPLPNTGSYRSTSCPAIGCTLGGLFLEQSLGRKEESLHCGTVGGRRWFEEQQKCNSGIATDRGQSPHTHALHTLRLTVQFLSQ